MRVEEGAQWWCYWVTDRQTGKGRQTTNANSIGAPRTIAAADAIVSAAATKTIERLREPSQAETIVCDPTSHTNTHTRARCSYILHLFVRPSIHLSQSTIPSSISLYALFVSSYLRWHSSSTVSRHAVSIPCNPVDRLSDRPSVLYAGSILLLWAGPAAVVAAVEEWSTSERCGDLSASRRSSKKARRTSPKKHRHQAGVSILYAPSCITPSTRVRYIQ